MKWRERGESDRKHRRLVLCLEKILRILDFIKWRILIKKQYDPIVIFPSIQTHLFLQCRRWFWGKNVYKNKIQDAKLYQNLQKHSLYHYLQMGGFYLFFFFADLKCTHLKILFLFLLRKDKGGRKKGRETSMCGCLSSAPYWGPDCNPGMFPDWESNQPPFGSLASSQSTDPHQPGQKCIHLNFILWSLLFVFLCILSEIDLTFLSSLLYLQIQHDLYKTYFSGENLFRCFFQLL